MAIDDQLAVLLAQNADLFATYEEWANGQIMLLAGTVDDPNSFNEAGGKTGALGYYPVVNVSGQTVYVACIARLKATALGGANAAVLEGLMGQVGGKIADVDNAISKLPGGVLSAAKWTRLPGIYRLLLSGQGTVLIDTRRADGAITVAADSYPNVGGRRYEYPFYDDAIEVRATLTGSATAEII
jgi:hypothetical protein